MNKFAFFAFCFALLLLSAGGKSYAGPTDDEGYQKKVKFIIHKRVETSQARRLMRPAPDQLFDDGEEYGDNQYAAARNITFKISRDVALEPLLKLVPNLKAVTLRFPPDDEVTPVRAPGLGPIQIDAQIEGGNPQATAKEKAEETYHHVLNVTGIGDKNKKLFTLVLLSRVAGPAAAKDPRDIFLMLYSDKGYRHDPDLGVRLLLALQKLNQPTLKISDELKAYLEANVLAKKPPPCAGATYYKGMTVVVGGWYSDMQISHSWTIPPDLTVAPSPRKYITLPWTDQGSLTLQACFRTAWPTVGCIEMSQRPGYDGFIRLVSLYETSVLDLPWRSKPPNLRGALSSRLAFGIYDSRPEVQAKKCRSDLEEPEFYSFDVFLKEDGTPERKYRRPEDQDFFTSILYHQNGRKN